MLLCYLRSARSDDVLRQSAGLCAESGATLSVVMPIIDATVRDGCCGIQGEQWRRIMDADSREAMRQAVRLLVSLGCPPASATIEVRPSVAEVAQRAAERCACDVVAVGGKRHPWSSGGLSRRQLDKLRQASQSEVVALVP